jgi:hypothetical protein
VLEALRIVEVRYWGWTPARYLALAATLAGMAVLATVVRRRAPAGA